MLVTLDDYKRAIKETDDANDQFHQDALDAAESAVLVYTDRDFASSVVTESRSYWYDGSGILNIDDADTVNSVTFAGNSAPLPNTAWIAKTEGPPSIIVYTFLELPLIDWTLGRIDNSMGLMGFTYNLDVFLNATITQRELQVTVNANFGWATVPKDVQRAVIWTAENFEQITPTGGEGGELISKAVAEVSESWNATSPSSDSERVEAIPARARALLNPYARAIL